MAAEDADTRSTRRWWRWAAAALAVATVVVVAVLTTSGGTGDSASPSGSPSPSATPTDEPSTSQTPTQDPTPPEPSAEMPTDAPTSVGEAELPPLGPGEPVVLPLDGSASTGGVTLTLTGLTGLTVTASGVGETAGPAIAVRLTAVNNGNAEVSLDDAQVNTYLGADGVPLSSTTSDDRFVPFSGRLAAGASASATYLFRTEAGLDDLVSVVVQVDPASPVLVFQGALLSLG